MTTGMRSTPRKAAPPRWPEIGEIIALDHVPSVETRQKIEGYLAHKWKLHAGLPADHTYKSTAPGPAALATLSGTASDADGTPLTNTWSLVSGPQPVILSNATALRTSVLFTAPGTYTFRLTADDGTDRPSCS